jgi:hypothetical protein
MAVIHSGAPTAEKQPRGEKGHHGLFSDTTASLCVKHRAHLILLADLDLDVRLALLVNDVIRKQLLVTLNLLVLKPEGGGSGGRGTW